MRRESRTKRNDPSLTKNLRDQFELELVALFEKAAPIIAGSLTGVRQNATIQEPTNNTPSATFARPTLAYIVDVNITQPAKNVVRTYTKTFYKSGETRAVEELKAQGIKASLIQFPADRQAIELLQERNLAALQGITDEMSKKIISELTDGILKGEGVEKLAKRITESVDGIGITRARTMAQTESMKAFVHANKQQYVRHGIEEVIWKTSRLENVCDVCGPRDRQKYPIDSAPECPAHPNCHCILDPFVEAV